MSFLQGLWEGAKDIGNAVVPLNPVSIMGGLSNIVGGVTGQSAAAANSANQASAQNAMNFSQASADKQMQFQERMAGSAYQRAMQDMKAAGLNPMLAFSQGGAAVPSGSSASGIAAQNQDVGAAALSNISNLAKGAKDATTIPASIAQMQASAQASSAQAAQTTQLTPLQVNKTQSETMLNSATAAKQQQEAIEIGKRIGTYGPMIKKMESETSRANEEARERKRLNDFLEKNPSLYKSQVIMDRINQGLSAGQTASQIIKNLSNSINPLSK